VLCLSEDVTAEFAARLIDARDAWQPVVGHLEEALVPVHGDVRRA
jgi:hypothetical protein